MSVSETDADSFNWGTLTSADAAPAEGSPAEVDITPTEVEGEAATAPDDGRPRDPVTGQFVKNATPEQMESAAAKYQNDQEKILKALAESQQYIGDLHREKQEWQQQMSELTQAIRTPRAAPNIEALIESNQFEGAAIYALNSGDRSTYEFVKQQWNEYSPGTPAVWEQGLQMQSKIAELEQRVQGVQQPIAEQQNTRAVLIAAQAVKAANPDFDSLEATMSQVAGEIAQSRNDWLLPALESGDHERAADALSLLVELARARAGGNLQDQARMAAQEHVAATEQAKREAIVASASSSMSEPHEKSPGEKLWDGFEKFDIGRLRDS